MKADKISIMEWKKKFKKFSKIWKRSKPNYNFGRGLCKRKLVFKEIKKFRSVFFKYRSKYKYKFKLKEKFRLMFKRLMYGFTYVERMKRKRNRILKAKGKFRRKYSWFKKPKYPFYKDRVKSLKPLFKSSLALVVGKYNKVYNSNLYLYSRFLGLNQRKGLYFKSLKLFNNLKYKKLIIYSLGWHKIDYISNSWFLRTLFVGRKYIKLKQEEEKIEEVVIEEVKPVNVKKPEKKKKLELELGRRNEKNI